MIGFAVFAAEGEDDIPTAAPITVPFSGTKMKAEFKISNNEERFMVIEQVGGFARNDHCSATFTKEPIMRGHSGKLIVTCQVDLAEGAPSKSMIVTFNSGKQIRYIVNGVRKAEPVSKKCDIKPSKKALESLQKVNKQAECKSEQ